MATAAWIVALCVLGAATKSATTNWQLVARSDAVVSAQLASISTTEGLPSGTGQLSLDQVHVIVGHRVDPRLSVGLHGLGKQDAARIRSLKSHRVVVFLGAYDETSKELQLAGDPMSALRQYSSQLVKQVREEARANEAASSRARARSAKLCGEGGHLQRRVRKLVAGLNGGSREITQSIEGLVKTGRAAVPYIICELEGAREAISVASVKVRVGNAALEQYAYYTPKEKVDLLDLVLTSITGVSFGSIANGASAAQRQRAIRGWWIYFGRLMSGGKDT